MKKLIIVLILCIGLLAGCSAAPYIYDICTYNSNTVNNAFASWVSLPQSMCTWMAQNITYKLHKTAFSPEQFYQNRWGDCNDYATFIQYVSLKHGITSYNMYVNYYQDGVRKAHCIGTFPGRGWSSNAAWHSWTSYSNIVTIFLNEKSGSVVLSYWRVTDKCGNRIDGFGDLSKSTSDFTIPYE